MDHKEASQLLEAYVLEALDQDDLEALESHLRSGCEECANSLIDLTDLPGQLALTVPQKIPPANVKEKLMESIKGKPLDTQMASPKPQIIGWIAAGIAALLALYFGIQSTSSKRYIKVQNNHYTKLENENSQLKEISAKIREENSLLTENLKAAKTEIALGFDKVRVLRQKNLEKVTILDGKNSKLEKELETLKQENASLRGLPSSGKKQVSNLMAEVARSQAEMMTLRKKLAELEDVTELIASPATQFINLSGVNPHRQAFGKVVIDPIHGSAVVYVYRLPEPPDCMEYQLWVIREGKATSAGVFKVGKDGSTVLKLHDFPDHETIASFSVTMEPTGGKPAPTGMMYLTGP